MVTLVPTRLTDWSYPVLEALCGAGQSEGDRHDFKLRLSNTQNTTKICCAFANSFGGFLVIGVHDKNFTIDGIEPDHELYKHLLDQVRAEPDIAISPPHTIRIPESQKLVYVFEVLQSPRRPHLPSKSEDRFFWKRQGSKCERMTLEEVRYQMNSYEEKREKLALLTMELHHIKRSVEEQANYLDGERDGTMFRFDIIDRAVIEAFSIIKSEPNVIGALDTLKKVLMRLNGEKERIIAEIAQRPHGAISLAIAYRDGVIKPNISQVFMLSDQIQNTLKDKFEVESPYDILFK